MPKVKFQLAEDVAEVVTHLQEMYDSGKLEGVILCALHGDTIICHWSNMSYLQRLGALEILHDDMKWAADGDYDGCDGSEI